MMKCIVDIEKHLSDVHVHFPAANHFSYPPNNKVNTILGNKYAYAKSETREAFKTEHSQYSYGTTAMKISLFTVGHLVNVVIYYTIHDFLGDDFLGQYPNKGQYIQVTSIMIYWHSFIIMFAINQLVGLCAYTI